MVTIKTKQDLNNHVNENSKQSFCLRQYLFNNV